MDIEELRCKCILLGVTILEEGEGLSHPWYAINSSGIPMQLPRKDQWLGRETERELLEDVLLYYGVFDGH